MKYIYYIIKFICLEKFHELFIMSSSIYVSLYTHICIVNLIHLPLIKPSIKSIRINKDYFPI